MADNEFSKELLLTDCLIRITVLENLVVESKLISREEFNNRVVKLSQEVADKIMKANETNNKGI